MGGGGVARSKYALSDERDDSRLLMPAGMFFVVIGGWLLYEFLQTGTVKVQRPARTKHH